MIEKNVEHFIEILKWNLSNINQINDTFIDSVEHVTVSGHPSCTMHHSIISIKVCNFGESNQFKIAVQIGKRSKMIKFVIVLLSIVALAVATPQEARTIREKSSNEGLGNFQFT